MLIAWFNIVVWSKMMFLLLLVVIVKWISCTSAQAPPTGESVNSKIVYCEQLATDIRSYMAIIYIVIATAESCMHVALKSGHCIFTMCTPWAYNPTQEFYLGGGVGAFTPNQIKFLKRHQHDKKKKIISENFDSDCTRIDLRACKLPKYP